MSWYDNPIGTLTSYLGQDATVNPGGAPTINTQTATNAATQAQLLQQQEQARQQQQQVLANQGQLAQTLQQTANGNGPSVALSQLGSGLNQIAGQQLGQAAGANGENAFAAKRAAAQNIAGAQTQLNGQQALTRANEAATAQSNLGNVLANQNAALGTTMGQDLNAAQGYAGVQNAGQSTIANNNAQANEQNAKQNGSFLGTLGNGISALAAL